MPDELNKFPVHFLLRYSDGLFGADTIGEHDKMAKQHGYCWFGKFGLGISGKIVEYAQRQLSEGIDTFVYLGTGARVTHVASVIGLLGGGDQVRAPESTKVPEYYRTAWCKAWFKLTRFAVAPEGVTRDLVMFFDRSAKPPLATSRGLMYVTVKPMDASQPTRRVMPVGFR